MKFRNLNYSKTSGVFASASSTHPHPPALAGDDHGTLRSLFTLFDHHVRVLLDTSASRSFISIDLCNKSEHILQPQLVATSLFVSNPIGGPANLRMICKGVNSFTIYTTLSRIFTSRYSMHSTYYLEVIG